MINIFQIKNNYTNNYKLITLSLFKIFSYKENSSMIIENLQFSVHGENVL